VGNSTAPAKINTVTKSAALFIFAALPTGVKDLIAERGDSAAPHAEELTYLLPGFDLCRD
jgi:hypothetical protein